RQAGVGHVSRSNLELAGDRVFWVPIVPGASLLAGSLPQLPRSAVPLSKLSGGKPPAFDLHLRSGDYLGVAQIVQLPPGTAVGALVVAKPAAALRSRWVQLAWELALAFGIGIPVAGLLVVYFSRRI